MSLLQYTSAAEVRAALGVNTTELPDSTLGLPMYDTVVEFALESVSPALQPLFETTAAIPTPTATQSKFLNATKLFVTYAVAKHLLVSLPLFSVQRLSDGKAEFQRQADAFEDVREGVETFYNSLRKRLEALLLLLDPDAVTGVEQTPVIATAVGLEFDPVTG